MSVIPFLYNVLDSVLTANFKLDVTLESSVASERSMASPVRDFTRI